MPEVNFPKRKKIPKREGKNDKKEKKEKDEEEEEEEEDEEEEEEEEKGGRNCITKKNKWPEENIVSKT